MLSRKCVDVLAYCPKEEERRIRPVTVYWESDDGRLEFHIDKVLDVRPAAHAKAGIQGDRYTCRFDNGKETYLWYCGDGKWYVAAKG